ncbi:MAG TPA: hypothetical protein VGC77_06830 [Rhodopseudomonas sp.]|uniref:hypothetical protein n=1 Tax=Rhodopseudomonas sp. TaxID=1078 RepID=UPI002EDB25A7
MVKPKTHTTDAAPDHPDIDKLTPATKPEASGALQEPEIAEGVDTGHPAVDANPRKGAKPDSNRIDFNDPTLSAHDAVVKNLEDQKTT